MNDITIAVISYNTKGLLKGCLDSIASQGGDLLNNTLVIDNASTDGSQELIKNKYPQVKLVANKQNLGFAKAANQAIKAAKQKFVLMLNSDTILHENSIESLLDFMKSCPQAGAVGPLLLNPDGSSYPSGRRFPSFIDGSMHAFLGIVLPKNRFTRRYRQLDWDRNNKKEVDWISGAAICLRKAAVQEIGFFDEDYFMYVEDMDLCYRLWQNGWKVFLLPESKVVHYIGQSSKQFSTRMVKEHEKSIYRFFLKQSANNWKRLLAPLVKGGLILRSALLINAAKFKANDE